MTLARAHNRDTVPLSNFLGDRPEAKGLDNYIDTGTSPDGEASVSEIQSTESSVGTGKLN